MSSVRFAMASVAVFLVASVFSYGRFDADVAAYYFRLNSSDCQIAVLVLSIIALLLSAWSYALLLFYEQIFRVPSKTSSRSVSTDTNTPPPDSPDLEAASISEGSSTDDLPFNPLLAKQVDYRKVPT